MDRTPAGPATTCCAGSAAICPARPGHVQSPASRFALVAGRRSGPTSTRENRSAGCWIAVRSHCATGPAGIPARSGRRPCARSSCCWSRRACGSPEALHLFTAGRGSGRRRAIDPPVEVPQAPSLVPVSAGTLEELRRYHDPAPHRGPCRSRRCLLRLWPRHRLQPRPPCRRCSAASPSNPDCRWDRTGAVRRLHDLRGRHSPSPACCSGTATARTSWPGLPLLSTSTSATPA